MIRRSPGCPAYAYSQPANPVEIVCDVPSAGTADRTARCVGELPTGSSQSLHAAVINNRTGAGQRAAGLRAGHNSALAGRAPLLTPLGALSVYSHV